MIFRQSGMKKLACRVRVHHAGAKQNGVCIVGILCDFVGTGQDRKPPASGSRAKGSTQASGTDTAMETAALCAVAIFSWPGSGPQMKPAKPKVSRRGSAPSRQRQKYARVLLCPRLLHAAGRGHPRRRAGVTAIADLTFSDLLCSDRGIGFRGDFLAGFLQRRTKIEFAQHQLAITALLRVKGVRSD